VSNSNLSKLVSINQLQVSTTDSYRDAKGLQTNRRTV